MGEEAFDTTRSVSRAHLAVRCAEQTETISSSSRATNPRGCMHTLVVDFVPVPKTSTNRIRIQQWEGNLIILMHQNKEICRRCAPASPLFIPR